MFTKKLKKCHFHVLTQLSDLTCTSIFFDAVTIILIALTNSRSHSSDTQYRTSRCHNISTAASSKKTRHNRFIIFEWPNSILIQLPDSVSFLFENFFHFLLFIEDENRLSHLRADNDRRLKVDRYRERSLEVGDGEKSMRSETSWMRIGFGSAAKSVRIVLILIGLV
jgi:hypothetical protein